MTVSYPLFLRGSGGGFDLEAKGTLFRLNMAFPEVVNENTYSGVLSMRLSGGLDALEDCKPAADVNVNIVLKTQIPWLIWLIQVIVCQQKKNTENVNVV